MLAGLARVLKSSADEMLGLEKAKGNGHAPDRRFLRRIERLHQLPAAISRQSSAQSTPSSPRSPEPHLAGSAVEDGAPR
jgi:hypothetical protein